MLEKPGNFMGQGELKIILRHQKGEGGSLRIRSRTLGQK